MTLSTIIGLTALCVLVGLVATQWQDIRDERHYRQLRKGWRNH